MEEESKRERESWCSVESLDVRVNDLQDVKHLPNITDQKYSRAEDFWR